MPPKRELAPLLARMPGSHRATAVAHQYLQGAHTSAGALLDSLDLVVEKRRTTRGAERGRLTHDELELLRATLVFTSSGLDASLHRLVRDALPILASNTRSLAYQEFVNYRRTSVKTSAVPPENFVDAVISDDPLGNMLSVWVESRTRGSYQGSGDLKKRVRTPLGISSARIDDVRLERLDAFFEARNRVVHDMDYLDPTGSAARNQRRRDSTLDECDLAFSVANDLIHETSRLLSDRIYT